MLSEKAVCNFSSVDIPSVDLYLTTTVGFTQIT